MRKDCLSAIIEGCGLWIGGYRAQLLRFPEQHFSVVCLCNVGNAGPEKRAHRVADIYLGDAMKEPAGHEEKEQRKKKDSVPVPAEKLTEYTGSYRSEELRATYQFATDDGKLVLKSIQSGDGFLSSPQKLALRPVGQDSFVVDDEGLEFLFERGRSGNVNAFRLDAGRTKGIEFQRK
jgi:hypothetical protein